MLVIRIARAGSRHVKHTWITFPNDRAICRQLLKIVIVTCTMSDSCYWTALNATWLVVISHFPCTCHRSNELIILYTKCSVPFQKFHCFCFFGKFWALFSNLAQQSGTAIPPSLRDRHHCFEEITKYFKQVNNCVQNAFFTDTRL